MLELKANIDVPSTRRMLHQAGAFSWWYFDLTTSTGDGLVFIWSFGLPFLPSARDACREGRPALDHPSLCLAVYKGGRTVYYSLTEYPGHLGDWHQVGDSFRFGNSQIYLASTPRRVTLDVHLEEPIPGSHRPLTGHIRAAGPRCALDAAASNVGTSGHRWSPILTAAEGEATLDWNTGGERLRGRCYFDTNASSLPIETLGISQWNWGRATVGSRELVYYLLTPHPGGADEVQLVLLVSSDGSTVQAPLKAVRWSRPRRGIYGLRRYRRLRIATHSGEEFDIRLTRVVDNGPFYLRLLNEVTDKEGRSGFGISEIVAPDRIHLPRFRPFVSMRVHTLEQSNSPWLPLFAGPRGDRFRRLLRYLRHRRAGKIRPAQVEGGRRVP